MIESVAEGILDTARKNDIHTVVVGRAALPWFKEMLHRHVGNELVAKAAGDLTVWVVQ